MANTTQNTEALNRAIIYETTILDEIRDNNFLSEGIHRDVSGFTDGDSVQIPTMGEVVLRDIEEDVDIPTDAVDTGSISMVINRFRGGGHYITDKAKEDFFLMNQLEAAIPTKMMHAIKENYEGDLLSTANQQTNGNANAINGCAHRFVASGTDQTLAIDDFIYAKLAFEKANLNGAPMIAIVDPLQEATLNALTNVMVQANAPQWEGIAESGFGQNNRFVKNIFGFDVYVSNRLPEVTAETVDTSGLTIAAPSGSATVAAGKVCQFIAARDEMELPYMGAWRRQPKVAYERQESKERDVYYLTSRWGFALQRPQSLITVLANSTKY